MNAQQGEELIFLLDVDNTLLDNDHIEHFYLWYACSFLSWFR